MCGCWPQKEANFIWEKGTIMTPEYDLNCPGLQKLTPAWQQTLAKQKTTSDRVKFLSHYDALTTLPNRRFFRNILEKALKNAQCNGHALAVVFFSLDPYSRINETLGPAISDRLVRCVAKRLKVTMGGSDAVGYWGSDTFALLLEGVGDRAQVVEIVNGIKQRMERRFFSQKQEFFLTSSIGIGLFPWHGPTVEVLLKNAGAALFEAQECGGNGYRFYAPDLNARSLKRFAVENRLNRGLQGRQFTLDYQPQVDTKNWRTTGAEALLRWKHPQLGLIPPTEFIPIAEKSGLIVAIGEWVLRAACLQLKKWHATGYPNLNLAINVSARQFQDADSVDTILEILKETGIAPECLELELTESSLLTNAEQAIKSFGKLKDNGVRLAIDDFGTGFSSLAYLRRLPLDTLKIAESFVHDASNPDGAALISSIVTLAQKLRLRVIAEGVETEEQKCFLQELGCDHMQGYLFGRPLPREEFKRFLACPDYQFEERKAFVQERVAS
jgi:diguanylate cyclase (GGDEF)-like protein